MASVKTHSEAEKENIEILGAKLGRAYNILYEDFTWLEVKWQEYRALFDTSPERIDLLNSAAGHFFWMIQNVLWGDTLLHLCRLTDPLGTAGKTNLTLNLLPSFINDSKLRCEVEKLIMKVNDDTAFARDWRNRHLSHRDRELSLSSKANPLAPASRAQVSDAILAIHEIFNRINERLLDCTLGFEVGTLADDAESLLYVIRDGLEARTAREERIRSGLYLQEDLHHRAI